MTTDDISRKVQLPAPGIQFIVNGIPAVGYKVFIYEAGTTTKAETWTAANGLTPNTNPAICDAEGRLNVWVPPIVPIPIVPNPPGPPGPVGPAGPPGPPGATGNTAEFSATIDIDSETIYTAFNGEFIELVPAPDADQVIEPVMIVMSLKYATTPYATNSGNFVVSWGPPTFPSPLPNGPVPAALLELATDTVFILFVAAAGSFTPTVDALGKNLTITLDAAPDGAPLTSIAVSDGGSGYVAGDTGTIDGGDANATYEVLTETAGVVDTISLTAGGTGYESTAAEATTVGGAQPGIGTGLLVDTASALLSGGTLRITTYYRKFTVQP
jgi:hypothetical protein